VFHAWQSVLGLLLYRAPHAPPRTAGGGYDHGRAVVSGMVTVALPRWLEVVLNSANYALPQFLAPGLPFTRAREAYALVKKRLGPYLTEATLNAKLLTNQVVKWQVGWAACARACGAVQRCSQHAACTGPRISYR
jgi:hypothetical protein